MVSTRQPKALLGIPRSFRPRAPLTMALAAAVVLLAGETQRLMAKEPDAEAFLARAAAAYGTTPPILRIEASLPVPGTYGYSADGSIYIKMETLGWETTRLHRLLAHEFAHHLLGNYQGGANMTIEIDTDVKGVEVLMKADGLSEREAFEAFYWGHGGRTVMRGGTPSWTRRPGHGSACDELNAFVARFPAQTWARPCP